jgi:hypothetical protein
MEYAYNRSHVGCYIPSSAGFENQVVEVARMAHALDSSFTIPMRSEDMEVLVDVMDVCAFAFDSAGSAGASRAVSHIESLICAIERLHDMPEGC